MNLGDKDTGCTQFRRFTESGPLVLDSLIDRAFVDGKDLKLTEEQFKSLYLLVQREGENITFEDLYKAAWEPLDCADCRQTAHEGMDRLVEKLGAEGKGIVRIEAAPGERYRYRIEASSPTNV